MRTFMFSALLVLLGVSSIRAALPTLAVGDYRSNGAVNTTTSTNWYSCSSATGGGTWATAAAPTTGTTKTLWIQSGHTLTVGGNFSCLNLCLSTGTAVGSQTTPAIVSCGLNVLTVAGNIHSFYGAVVTTTTTFGTLTLTTGTGATSYNITSTAGSGSITFTGTAPTVAGSWSGLCTTTWTAIFNPSGLSATLGTDFQASTVSVNTSCTLTNNNVLTVATALSGTGGLTNGATGTLNIGGTSGITTLTASAAGNTVNYTGAAQTVHANTYHHLGLSGSLAKTMTSVSTINGNLTLSGTATATTATGTTIGGNLSIGNGTTFTAAGFTLTVTGTTTVGGGTSGNLTISSATGTKTFTGLVTISTGATWSNTSANSAVTFRGGITNNGTFNSGTGTHTFDTNNQALNGTLTISGTVTISSITLTNSGTLTCAATTSVNGSFGTLTNNTSASLTITGTFSGPTLTATANPNTVTYNGGSGQTPQAVTYHHLTFSGAGTKTMTTFATTTVNGDWTVNATASLGSSVIVTVLGSVLGSGAITFTTSATINVGAAWSNNGTFTPSTGTVNFNGSGAQTIPALSSSYYNLSCSTGGTKTTGGAITVTNIWTVASGVTFAVNSPNSLTLSGTVSHAVSGATITIANGGTITQTAVASWTSVTAVTVDGLLEFNYSASTQTIPNNITVNANGELRLTGTSAKTIGSGNTIAGKLSVQTTGAIGSSFSITFSAGSTLEYKTSAGAQTAGTIEWPGTSGPTNVIINNASGVSYTTTSRTVAGTLTLTSGKLTLGGSANLTLSNATLANQISGGSSTSYVATTSTGTLTRNGVVASATFPVGDATNYMPVSFSSSSSANYSVRVKAPSGTFDATSSLSKVWEITSSSSTPSITPTFNWPVAVQGANFTAPTVSLYRYISSWLNTGVARATISGTDPRAVTFATVAVTTTSAAEYAPFNNPANDDCSAPTSLGTLSAGCNTTTVNTSNASQSTAATCAGTADDDVWFSFVLPVGYTSVNYSPTEISGSTDRVYQLYSGACGTPPTGSIYCSDNETGVFTGLSAGTTYLLRVYTWGSGTTVTNYTLNLCLPPLNDECAGAFTPTITGAGGTCSPQTYDASAATESTSPGTYGSCDGNFTSTVRDVWFTFVATATSHQIDIDGSASYRPVVDAYGGSCGALGSSLGCATASAIGGVASLSLTGLTPGNTYRFRVYHSASPSTTEPATTTFTVCILTPPTNDECAGAASLSPAGAGATSCTSPPTYTTAIASESASPGTYASCDGGVTSTVRDVWFSFTATATSHTISIAPSASFIPVIDAYAGSCGTLGSSIGCSAGSVAGTTVTLQLSGLTVSSTYRFRVYHKASTVPATTTFTVCVLTAPQFDECANAASVSVTATGATCTPAFFDVRTTASESASPGTYASCDGNFTSTARDVWFTFVAGATSHQVNIYGSASYQPVVQAYSGTCASLGSAIGCGYASAAGGTATMNLTGLTIGNTYRFRVYHAASTHPATTTFSVCILSPPANDAPCGATLLTVGAGTCSNSTGDVAVASQTFTGCAGTANDDVWFKFVASAATQTIVVDGSASFDAVVQAYYNAACGSIISTSNIGSCRDNTTSGGIETLVLTGLTPGLTYYIRVYDYNTGFPATTDFTICVIGPPVNDDPCGAITLPVNTGSTCTSTTTGDVTAYSTQTFSGNSCAGTANDDVWFKFTATATSHNIKVTGSTNFAPVVEGYYNAACGSIVSGSKIGTCAYSSTSASTVDMTLTGLTAGNTYYVRVYDYWSGTPTSTTFTVCVQSPPVNDEPCGAVSLGTITTSCSGTAGDATLASQTRAITSGCSYGTAANDVWYTFTTASSGLGATSANIKVVSSGGNYDPVIEVFAVSGSCSSFTYTSKGCRQYFSGGTETLHLTNLAASTTYYVRVYHDNWFYTPTSYAFTICAVIPPVNDDCSGTALTVGGGASSGTTVNASMTYDSYYGTGYDDDDVWYNFTATGASHQLVLVNSSIDGVLDLRTTSCPGGRIVAHDYSGYAGANEVINVTGLTNGQNYKLRVFSFGSVQGAFTIAVNTNYSPSGNDNIANAITASVGTTNGNAYVNYGMEVGEPEGANWAFDPDVNTVSLGNTAWFVFTPSTTGVYSFSGTTGGNQFLMAVYSAASPAALLAGSYSEIGSTPKGASASISCKTLTAGTNYYIQFNGNVGASGTPALTITTNATPVNPTFTAGASSLCPGGTSTYTATASGASSIAYSIVSGGASINATTGDVSSVTSAFTVRATATFACGTTTADFPVSITTYNITASAGTGGSISPSGVTAVTCGNNQVYTVTANGGYYSTGVTVNGTPYPDSTSTFTFVNVQGTNTIVANFAASFSGVTVNLKVYLQGYYLGGGALSPMRKLLGISTNPAHVDTLTVELRDSANLSTVFVASGLLLSSDGTVAAAAFNGSSTANSYYIVVKHRNSLETWSKYTVTGQATVNYDFTTAIDKAYGDNMIATGDGKFAIYGGDINQDDVIDATDMSLLRNDLPNFVIGVHSQNDLTGDGIVEDDDYNVMQTNVNRSLSSQHP